MCEQIPFFLKKNFRWYEQTELTELQAGVSSSHKPGTPHAGHARLATSAGVGTLPAAVVPAAGPQASSLV